MATRTSSRPASILPQTTQPGADLEQYPPKDGHSRKPIPDPELEHSSRRGLNPLEALVIAAKSGCFLGACTNVRPTAAPAGNEY